MKLAWYATLDSSWTLAEDNDVDDVGESQARDMSWDC